METPVNSQGEWRTGGSLKSKPTPLYYQVLRTVEMIFVQCRVSDRPPLWTEEQIMLG